MKSLSLIFDKIIEKYHKFFTWQNEVICQECGKKIGVSGVMFGTEEEVQAEIEKKIKSDIDNEKLR